MNDMNKNELKEKVVDYVSKVFFYCIKRCNNRMDAEDLSQTILLEIIQNIDKGAHIDNFDYYVWGVCKNQYNMYLRKTIKDRNNLELNDDIEKKDDSLSALDEILEDEKIRRMNQAIKLLSKDYAEILYAYYVEDKTLKFIAKELNLPLGTVKKRLFTIRQKLKEYLDMERLNGKKAYIPKTFASSASYPEKLPFDPHDVVKPLLFKNLLYHTFNNPCTLEDLSIEMGISLPYVEDIVNILLGVKYLIKDGNKYKSNIAFLDMETVQKVRLLLKEYYDEYVKEVISFAKDNIQNYRNKLVDNNISDGLLMWSLLMTIKSFTKQEEIKYTKKYGSYSLAFCMYEVTFSQCCNEDFYISQNGFGSKNDYRLYGFAYPASPSDYPDMPKIQNRIKYHSAGKGFTENASFFSKVAFNEVNFNELSRKLQEEVQNTLINLNYMRVDNNVLKLVVPMMNENDFEDFKWQILDNKKLEDSYSKLFNHAKELIIKELPDYLKDEYSFLVASVLGNDRTMILKEAERQGLLDFDEEHDYFVYNMLLVKC
jgi:RNA polymerase sigma factor (sigma-70 family)